MIEPLPRRIALGTTPALPHADHDPPPFAGALRSPWSSSRFAGWSPSGSGSSPPRRGPLESRPVALFGGVGIALVLLICSSSSASRATRPCFSSTAAAVFLTGLVDDVLSLSRRRSSCPDRLPLRALFFDYRLIGSSRRRSTCC